MQVRQPAGPQICVCDEGVKRRTCEERFISQFHLDFCPSILSAPDGTEGSSALGGKQRNP